MTRRYVNNQFHTVVDRKGTFKGVLNRKEPFEYEEQVGNKTVTRIRWILITVNEANKVLVKYNKRFKTNYRLYHPVLKPASYYTRLESQELPMEG